MPSKRGTAKSAEKEQDVAPNQAEKEKCAAELIGVSVGFALLGMMLSVYHELYWGNHDINLQTAALQGFLVGLLWPVTVPAVFFYLCLPHFLAGLFRFAELLG